MHSLTVGWSVVIILGFQQTVYYYCSYLLFAVTFTCQIQNARQIRQPKVLAKQDIIAWAI